MYHLTFTRQKLLGLGRPWEGQAAVFSIWTQQEVSQCGVSGFFLKISTNMGSVSTSAGEGGWTWTMLPESPAGRCRCAQELARVQGQPHAWDSAEQGQGSRPIIWSQCGMNRAGLPQPTTCLLWRSRKGGILWFQAALQAQGEPGGGTLCEGKGAPSSKCVQPSSWAQDSVVPASASCSVTRLCAVLSGTAVPCGSNAGTA